MTGAPIVECVFGQRGGGKSTLAAELVADRPKVLAFDPQGDYRGRGWVTASTRKEVEGALIAAGRGSLRVAYSPDFRRADPIREGAWLADTGFIAQAGFPAVDPRPLTILYDEAHLAFPTEKARADALGPIRAAILQGRHAGIGLLFVTQRPSNLGTDARSQAAAVYCFGLMQQTDRKAIEEMHPAARAALDGLSAFQFLKISAEGVGVYELKHRAGIVAVKPRK